MLFIHLSILHWESVRESLRRRLLLSYYKQGRRRAALCTARSSYTESSASQSLNFTLMGRITGRISQDPDWPTVVSVISEFPVLTLKKRDSSNSEIGSILEKKFENFGTLFFCFFLVTFYSLVQVRVGGVKYDEKRMVPHEWNKDGGLQSEHGDLFSCSDSSVPPKW